jgi:hypothetical protein
LTGEFAIRTSLKNTFLTARDGGHHTIDVLITSATTIGPNGQELFFVAPEGAIMAVRVDPRGGAWSTGSPVKVVDGPYPTGAPASGRNYDVSADGKRFLLVKQPPGNKDAAPQIVMVQHWAEELKRLVPVTR